MIGGDDAEALSNDDVDRIADSVVEALDFTPTLHPRDPRTGKFVERPYSVPDDIAGMDTGDIIGELAAANDDFAEQVEGIAVDLPGDDDGSAVPTEIQELIDTPDAGAGGSVADIESLSIDDVSEGDRIRVDGMPATVTSKNEPMGPLGPDMEIGYEPDRKTGGTVGYENGGWVSSTGGKPGEVSVTSIGPDNGDYQQFGESGQMTTAARLLDTEYGPKAAFDTPYEAKEAIKELDFDETHRTWDSDIDEWTVDLSSVDEMREKLVEEGYRVRIRNDILQAAEQA